MGGGGLFCAQFCLRKWTKTQLEVFLGLDKCHFTVRRIQLWILSYFVLEFIAKSHVIAEKCSLSI